MSFIALEGKDLIIINKQTQSFSCPSPPSCALLDTLFILSALPYCIINIMHIVSLAYPYDTISIALFVVLPLNV